MSFLYDVDPARALPTAAYREPAFEADLHHVFRSDWVWVGTSDEVAEPGDYVTVEVGRQPVIVLRNQSGDLAALSNMCAHRGTLLADGSGNSKRFQCPYHAWTYADDGRLLAVPFADRDTVDRDEHCLPSYRADEWHGLVFVSLDPTVAPLADRLAHLAGIARDADMGNLRHWTTEREEEVWDANWKLVISNAMESYHLFKVHEKTLEPISPTSGAYYITGNADGTATGGSTKGGATKGGTGDYTLLSLPPNFVGVLSAGSLLWQAVQPLAHDRTRIITGGAYRTPGPGENSGVSKWTKKALSKAIQITLPNFLPEDRFICERGQRAAGGDYRPGTIVPMEQVIVDFHHYLNRRLHGAEVPPVRTSSDVGVARSAGVPE